MVVVITSGAHWRDTQVPHTSAEPRQFAHLFDPDSPEDVPHEALNFITYASALGDSSAPHVLVAPEMPEDPQDAAQVRVMMSDWCEIVTSATHVPVVTR